MFMLYNWAPSSWKSNNGKNHCIQTFPALLIYSLHINITCKFLFLLDIFIYKKKFEIALEKD